MARTEPSFSATEGLTCVGNRVDYQVFAVIGCYFSSFSSYDWQWNWVRRERCSWTANSFHCMVTPCYLEHIHVSMSSATDGGARRQHTNLDLIQHRYTVCVVYCRVTPN